MASLGRSANVSKMQAKRAASRLSGKTVPAATRAAHRVCVCIEPPPSVSKLVASYSFLIIHYRPFGPLPQLTEVVGNGHFFALCGINEVNHIARNQTER